MVLLPPSTANSVSLAVSSFTVSLRLTFCTTMSAPSHSTMPTKRAKPSRRLWASIIAQRLTPAQWASSRHSGPASARASGLNPQKGPRVNTRAFSSSATGTASEFLQPKSRRRTTVRRTNGLSDDVTYQLKVDEKSSPSVVLSPDRAATMQHSYRPYAHFQGVGSGSAAAVEIHSRNATDLRRAVCVHCLKSLRLFVYQGCRLCF